MLLLQHFHTHWHLRRSGIPNQILEPLRCTDSVKRQSNVPLQSTRREPSAFEAVEPSKRPPTCSRCHQVGHTRAGNNCPLRHEELLARLGVPSDPVVVAIEYTNTTQGRASETCPSGPDTPLPEIVQPLFPSEADAHYDDHMTEDSSSSIHATDQPEISEDAQDRILGTPGQPPERSSTCPVTTSHSMNLQRAHQEMVHLKLFMLDMSPLGAHGTLHSLQEALRPIRCIARHKDCLYAKINVAMSGA